MYYLIYVQTRCKAQDRSGLLHPDAEYWCIKWGRALWCIIRPWPLPPVWLMTWHITPYSHHFSLSPLLFKSVPLTTDIMLYMFIIVQPLYTWSFNCTWLLSVLRHAGKSYFIFWSCSCFYATPCIFSLLPTTTHTPQMFLLRVHAPQKNQAGSKNKRLLTW